MTDRPLGKLAAGDPQAPAPTSRHNHAADRAGGSHLVGIVVQGATVTGDLTGETGDWHLEATDLHLGDDRVTFYSLLNDGRLRLDLSEITPAATRLLTVPNVVAGRLGVGLKGTTTWDPASLSNGAIDVKTLTVTGAAVGDPVSVGFARDLQWLLLSGYVSAADTVTAVLYNPNVGLGTVNLSSGTLTALVWKT